MGLYVDFAWDLVAWKNLVAFGVNVALQFNWPFEGGHDADVAHGENEFETPALRHYDYFYFSYLDYKTCFYLK